MIIKTVTRTTLLLVPLLLAPPLFAQSKSLSATQGNLTVQLDRSQMLATNMSHRSYRGGSYYRGSGSHYRGRAYHRRGSSYRPGRKYYRAPKYYRGHRVGYYRTPKYYRGYRYRGYRPARVYYRDLGYYHGGRYYRGGYVHYPPRADYRGRYGTYQPYAYGGGYRNPYGNPRNHYKRPYYYKTNYYPNRRYQHHRFNRAKGARHSSFYPPSRGEYAFWPLLTYYPPYHYPKHQQYYYPVKYIPPHYSLGSWEKEYHYPLCTAHYGGFYFPGALVNNRCKFVYGSRVLTSSRYNVPTDPRFRWVYARDGRLPNRAQAVANEAGKPVYACQAHVGNSYYAGRVVGKRCHFPVGSRMMSTKSFSVYSF